MSFNPRFVQLHVHSHYSLLDGLGKIPDLVQRAKTLGMQTLALTDHGVLYGAIEFYQTCLEAGIKPIIGIEAYIAPRQMNEREPRIDSHASHLILLAKNQAGYKNLIQLTTAAHLRGFYYKPRVDRDFLAHHAEGLIALSACINGVIGKHLRFGTRQAALKEIALMQSIFGKDNFYLEIQPHFNFADQVKINKQLLELARETGASVVATNDIHYILPEDKDAHEVLLAVQQGKDVDDQERLSMQEVHLSMFSPEEMVNLFADVPEAIENTARIADQCNLTLKLGETIIPHFNVPEGQTLMSYLRAQCDQGLALRYPEKVPEAVHERLEYELGVIKNAGFPGYFLIVADLVNAARERGISTNTRGSAAGSLVAYLTGITEIDPFRYKLVFERFLNPDRISPPDVDLDIADTRRGEMIEYLVQKYGADHVAQIITFGTMAARGAIRDTGRALGMAYLDVDRIAKLVPFGLTLEQALQESGELALVYKAESETKRLLDMARRLEGVARHASTHAAGIVVSKEPLTEYVPLQHAARADQTITTQYEMNAVEAIGLLKLDLLGLANLTILQNALRIIRKTKGDEIDFGHLNLNDKKTFQLLARGETIGVFQFASDGMQRYLKELKPNVIDDLIAMVALYRPGPMELIPQYIARKHGRESISYLVPELKPILQDTYGIAVYQEQVLQIARDIAGFTMGEADILRKAVGKKIKSLLLKQQKKFVDKAVARKVNQKIAEKLFEFIEPFARYGFNRAHATSYALVAYQTAYLKAHYPVEFMAALLTSDRDNIDKISVAIEEAKRLGIMVKTPAINESFEDFGVVSSKGQEATGHGAYIRFGLSAIKNVGKGVAEEIVAERTQGGPYASLEDFLLRLSPKTVNKKTLESLIRSGALDGLGERGALLHNLDTILYFSHSAHQNGVSSSQESLFGSALNQTIKPHLKLEDAPAAEQRTRLAWEKELLGIYLSEHPLESYRASLERLVVVPIRELILRREGEVVSIAGIITSVQKIVTRSKEPMVFARFEDLNAATEVVVFPKTLRAQSDLWQVDTVLTVKGRISHKDGALKIMAESAQPINEHVDSHDALTQQPTQPVKEVEKEIVLVLTEGTTRAILEELKKACRACPGPERVVLEFMRDAVLRRVRTTEHVTPKPAFIAALEKIGIHIQ